jgi:DNA topoisomerase-3
MDLMEKNHIGTDASMATHINNIVERGFVKVETKTRKLVPVDLGKALILGLNSIDPELVDPHLRRKIETAIDLIATGHKTKDQVLKELLPIFKNKYLNYVQNFT